MDILAHSLWAGVGLALAQRHLSAPERRHDTAGPPFKLSRGTVIATLVLAVLPDLLHLLPILAWWLLAGGSLAAVVSYSTALPGEAPTLPPLVALWSHHLHCTMHSALVLNYMVLAAVFLWLGLNRRKRLPASDAGVRITDATDRL